MAEAPGTDQEPVLSLERGDMKQLLDDLLPLTPVGSKEPDEPRILYQLLDEVPNGRKLMSHLFSSAAELPERRDLSNGHLHKAASGIADRWYQEERRASTQALPAAIQLDAPVIFSWSKKAAGLKNSPQKSDPTTAARETTNQTLFKSISARLNEISKQQETIQYNPEDDGDSERATAHPNRQRWAGSEFHVDPLQQFVATALPRPSKKENTDKKKVKRRSLLFFWGSGTHKKKDDPRTTKDPELEQDRSSTERPHPIEESHIPDEKKAPGKDLLEGDDQTQSPTSSRSLNSFVPLKPKKK